MARTLDSNIQSRLSDRVIYPVWFAQLDFDSPSGTLYLHTDLDDISTLSQTWTGTGDLGSVGPVEETIELGVTQLRMTLSVADSTLINEALAEDHQDRDVTLYIGLRDVVTGALVSDPEEIWFGQVAEMPITPNQIELIAENEMRRWDQAANKFYTDVELQNSFSGDLGLQFLARLKNLTLRWPNADSNYVDVGLLDVNPVTGRDPERGILETGLF